MKTVLSTAVAIALALLAVGLVGCSPEPEPIPETPPEEMGNRVTDPNMREQFRNGGGNAGPQGGNAGQGLGSQAPH